MFAWLFKLFGYVPAEKLAELQEFVNEIEEKARASMSDKQSINMDARTLFDAMWAEGGKPGNERGAIRFRDSEGDSVEDESSSCFRKIGDGTYEFALVNVDIPAYKEGPVGELWLMYSTDHSIEDISIETCCWGRNIW